MGNQNMLDRVTSDDGRATLYYEQSFGGRDGGVGFRLEVVPGLEDGQPFICRIETAFVTPFYELDKAEKKGLKMFNMTPSEKKEYRKEYRKKHGHVVRIRAFDPCKKISNSALLQCTVQILCDLVYKYWRIYDDIYPASDGIVTAVEFTPEYVRKEVLPNGRDIADFFTVIYNKYFPNGEEVQLMDDSFYRFRGLTVRFRDHEGSNNG